MKLARILEPELMDTEDDALEYHAMDFSEADGECARIALELLAAVERPTVVDFGTGTAKVPVLMATARPDLRVLAIDPAKEMLRVASAHIAEHGLEDVISTAALDGRATGLPAAHYDLVLCNSTMHHLHEPASLLREMKRVARPDGGVLIRDLERPATMDDAWAIVKRVAAGDSMNQQQLFFDSLCASLTRPEMQRLLTDVGWGALAVEKTSDRHWTVRRAAAPRGRR
ncbi:MAG: class I SAM-dependent methyltransferase [Sandaracinaceae bacterium]|nr:class I SAM-dependent methyltransferase [Sandaracinaceae bacterium]